MTIGEQPREPAEQVIKRKSWWARFWGPITFKAQEIDLWGLLKTAGVFLFLGIFFYILEALLEDHHWPGTHIAQHLTVAFWVAFLSIIGIEISAKRRARHELDRFIEEFQKFKGKVSENVFEAVIGRIVPDPIVEEVKELLRSPFMKTECVYTIRFMRRYDTMPSNFCVVRRDLRFRMHNLSAHPTSVPIRSIHIVDEDYEKVWEGRPYHLELWVNNSQIDSKKYLKDERGLVLEHSVDLAPKGSASIFLLSEEPMRIEANRAFYSQGSPVDALVVAIENECRDLIGDIEVQMHHPGRGEVIHERPDRYILRRAFFPGQGFEVSWKKVTTSATQEDSKRQPKELRQTQAEHDVDQQQSPKPAIARTPTPSNQGNLPL